MHSRASKKWGCVTIKALPLPCRNAAGCLLPPSDVFLLLSVVIQVGNGVVEDLIHL